MDYIQLLASYHSPARRRRGSQRRVHVLPIQKPTPHAVIKNSTYNFQNMSLGYAVGLYVDLLHFE